MILYSLFNNKIINVVMTEISKKYGIIILKSTANILVDKFTILLKFLKLIF